MTYEVEVRTSGREIFCVEADSPEDARRQVEDGPDPTLVEVIDAGITRVSECEDCG